MVDPLSDVEVNVPGVIAMLVAPLTIQFNVLLLPELIVVGAATKEVMVGLLSVVPVLTVTVAVDVADPELFVAVRV